MTAPSAQMPAWSYVLDEPARILVVDDDPIFCEFARVHLSTPAASVDAAPNGEVALNLLTHDDFDIVLCDIEMPVLDGFELLAKIRSDSRLSNLPVVMLTGKEDILSIDRAYNLGATAFTTKPVNWRSFSYQIRYVLRNAKLGCDPAKTSMDQGEWSYFAKLASFRRKCSDGLSSILQSIKTLRTGHVLAIPPQVAVEIERIEIMAQALRDRCEAASLEQQNAPARAEINSQLGS
jgi:DNA-binding response OmpR family regulator